MINDRYQFKPIKDKGYKGYMVVSSYFNIHLKLSIRTNVSNRGYYNHWK